MPPQDCQAQACEIQSCLSRTNFNEEKCTQYVDALYKCCENMYASADQAGGEVPKSTACPIRSVVDRRIKAIKKREQEAK